MDRIHIGQPPGLGGCVWESRPGSRQKLGSSEARGNSSAVIRVEMGSGPGNFEPLATENL